MVKLAHFLIAEVLSNTLRAKNAPDCFISITWAISGFIFVKYMQRDARGDVKILLGFFVLRQVLVSELFSTF